MKSWKAALAISLIVLICIVIVRIATHGRLEISSLYNVFVGAGHRWEPPG
jgi:hypothetical protein